MYVTASTAPSRQRASPLRSKRASDSNLPRWNRRTPDAGANFATIAALVAGSVAALGAVAAWRQLQDNRRQAEAVREETDEQLRLARDGQLTDRFTRAVDQLGNEDLYVRLGGIYALERIARDSEIDAPTIVEVLAAFIRGHSHHRPSRTYAAGSTGPSTGLAGRDQDDADSLLRRAADVQAALTVLGRRVPVPGSRPDLSGSELAGAHLFSADLNLASLPNADLTEADFMMVDLTQANLTSANLTRADLRDVSFVEAFFTYATLIGARLVDVDLTGADLAGADLAGVVADTDTRWPDGFDPVAAEADAARLRELREAIRALARCRLRRP
jgi:hypothetical protein